MVPLKPFFDVANIIRARLSPLRTRGGGGDGPSRWFSPSHEERPKGFAFNRTSSPPPGQWRKWEDWELPCYTTSFLTIVILGVGLGARPNLTIETWMQQKALERLELEAAQSTESD